MELFKLFGTISLKDGEARQGLKNIDSEAQRSGGRMMDTFKKVGGVLAAAFAVDKLVSFGKSSIEAAANMQALSAQFDQVFGADAGEARGVIENLGKEFGMVPNRLKPAMTQMTSMFKGLGLETGDAMDQATKAVTMTADAAAFYDKSFEDANAALNSFVKGNYEGGEAIGLFANETQLSSWAAKNLGKDWKTLDEAGKQVARLEFAKAMQEAAGATGQASRESDSYENQLGNLKAVWEELKAKLATPFLAPVVSALKELATWIQGNIPAIEKTMKTVFDVISTGASAVWGFFKEYILPVFDEWFGQSGTLMPAIKEIFNNVFNGIKEYGTTVWNFFKENLLPILTDLYTWIQGHMPTIKETVKVVFEKIREVTRNAWAFYKENFLPILANLLQWVRAHMPQIKSIIETAFTVVKNVVKTAWGIFENLLLPVLKKLWDWIKPHIPKIEKIIGDSFDAIVNTIEDVVGIFEAVTGAIKKAVDWLDKWNNKEPKKKTVTVEERRVTTSGKLAPVPKYATGTNYHPGGAAIVGERGPELITNLPRGAKVSTASETKQLLQQNESKQPIVIQMVLDSKVIAQETYEDISVLMHKANKMTARKGGVVFGN